LQLFDGRQRRLSVCLAPYTDRRFMCSDALRGRWISSRDARCGDACIDRTVLLTRSGIVMDDQVRGPRSAQHLVDLST
jgi:hypothetical protein